MGKVGIAAFSNGVIKPRNKGFPHNRRPRVFSPVTANQVSASGIHQSPENNRHNQYGSFARARATEKQNVFSPAFQKRKGFTLNSRRLE
jgi:hypothetical protein